MPDHQATSCISSRLEGHVGIVEMHRPPHNYFDQALLIELATAFEALESEPGCRAIVLCAQGNVFCAGADFNDPAGVQKTNNPKGVNPIYTEAIRLFSIGIPVVAAVHGSAIGGGLGLALVADFRVTCAEAKFAANFNRLGITPGFGLTTTLPRLIGVQAAARLFYTGRRVDGAEATAIGLADILVARDKVRDAAVELATDIAVSSPVAVSLTRKALRNGLVDAIRLAVVKESQEQNAQFLTIDFAEGVLAMKERRAPIFGGR